MKKLSLIISIGVILCVGKLLERHYVYTSLYPSMSTIVVVQPFVNGPPEIYSIYGVIYAPIGSIVTIENIGDRRSKLTYREDKWNLKNGGIILKIGGPRKIVLK